MDDRKASGIAKTAEIRGIDSGNSQIDPSLISQLSTGVSNEERHQLIAQAAYFRAERRSFIPGCELEDWLNAETEIDTSLAELSRNGSIENT
jgi:hypothetical protein